MEEFIKFPKLARVNRDMIITEKLDGTNAQVFISDDGTRVKAGSRNRWLEVGKDNYGFAGWVLKNHDELLKLGPGRHYGEWWGQGIQRKYGLTEKRFSLFNTGRWTNENCPKCCSVVPVLYEGPFDTAFINSTVLLLKATGSVAAPGYNDPEGIVVFHTASQACMKVTCKNDESPKSLVGGKL